MADGKANGAANSPDVAALAVAGIAVISAVTGIIGGVTGAVARVARNNQDALPWAIFLVFVAIGFALAGSLIGRIFGDRPASPAHQGAGDSRANDVDPTPAAAPRTARQETAGAHPQSATTSVGQRPTSLVPVVQSVLLLASLIVFGFASWCVVSALSESLATPDRPNVSAKWTSIGGRWVLTGTAKASGLKANDHLTVVVSRLVDNGDPGPPFAKPSIALVAPPTPWWSPPDHWVFEGGRVYQQTVGADIDGNATVTFEIPLPDGYDAMQVVGTLGNEFYCPLLVPSGTPPPNYACLTLDAPDSPPRSATPASPGA